MKSSLFFYPIFFALLAIFIGCKESPSGAQHGSMLPRGQAEHLDRFEQEILAFEQADKLNMPPKTGILFTGSSSIRLWKSLSEDFEKLPVINRGFGGSTIPEVNYYADRIVHKYAPKLIVFYCGENDIAGEHPPAVVFQDFKKFIGETEKNLAGTKVLFISAKPSPSRWEHWRKYQTFNGMVKQFAEGRPDLYFVDIGETLMGEDGNPDPSLFVDDMLHMNEKGYERWTAVIQPLVAEIFEGKEAQ